MQLPIQCTSYQFSRTHLALFWHVFCPFDIKREQFIANLPQNCIFFANYLVMSEKSSTFACSEFIIWILKVY